MDKNTDLASEAAWTDDTVYDLLAEAFESGGEIRGGQLIAQRHNETIQSAIEKMRAKVLRELRPFEAKRQLAESRAPHASEHGELIELLKTILSFPSTVTPEQIERVIDKYESCK